MSKYHGKNLSLYIGGYDISSLTAGVTPNSEVEMAQYAVADGSGGYHSLPGLAKDSMSLDGIFDDNYMAVLNALRAASSGYQIMIPLGTTIESRALAVDEAWLANYVWKAIISDINRITAELMANDLPWDHCKLIFPKAQKTSDGNHTGIDDGAATTEGLVAYLQVFECGADDALIVKIQDDDNGSFSSPRDLITFTTANGITTERKTVDWYDGGEDLDEDLDASETGVDVTDGSAFSAGQTIKIDSEIMYISSIASNTLTVIRGYAGSGAATHSSGADIYERSIQRYVRVTWSGTPTYQATFAVVYKRN